MGLENSRILKWCLQDDSPPRLRYRSPGEGNLQNQVDKVDNMVEQKQKFYVQQDGNTSHQGPFTHDSALGRDDYWY